MNNILLIEDNEQLQKYISDYLSAYGFSVTVLTGIRDEGIGIMAEDLPRIFDLFYTGINGRQSKESTGIGLSMVKHICKKLGHEVAVESQVGQGTTVMITFLTKM